MSEVEKLYELAGVELVADVKFPTKDVSYNVGYPPFTAEKQLELIKWLSAFKQYEFESMADSNGYTVGVRNYLSNDKHWGRNKVFELSFADLIIQIWYLLTETEQEEIRKILER